MDTMGVGVVEERNVEMARFLRGYEKKIAYSAVTVKAVMAL